MSNSYVINFTDRFSDPGNKEKFTIQPFTTNGSLSPTNPTLDPRATNASTSILLVGKGITNYGERLQEDIVHILENFAGSVAPVNPTKGQLWYFVNSANTAFTELRVYNPAIGASGSGGTNWEAVQFVQTAEPLNPVYGEVWFDPTPSEVQFSTTGSQLKVWNNTAWVSVSANYLPITGGTMSGQVTLPTGPGTNQAVRRDFVEGITNALDTRIDDLEPGGTLEALRINGTNAMTGNLDMGNTRLTNLSPSVTSSDGVRQDQVILRTGANTMTANLNLNNNKVINLSAGTTASDATRVDQVVLKVGGILGSNLDMNLFKITNMAPSTDPTDATSRQQVMLVSGVNAMLGDMNLGGFKATSLGTPTVGTDAATKGYVDGTIGSSLLIDGTNSMTANLNAGSFKVINVQTPTNPSDAATKDYVDTQIATITVPADIYTFAGSVDGTTNELTLMLTAGAPDVVIDNVAAGDHRHFERGEVFSTSGIITIPHTVVYKMQTLAEGDDPFSPFNREFAAYNSGGGGPFDAFPYVPIRNIFHYIDSFKAEKNNTFLGGQQCTLLPGTTLSVGKQPRTQANFGTNSYAGEQVPGIEWTMFHNSPERGAIITAIAAQTVFRTPQYIIGRDHLHVHVDGVKKYRNEPARQTIDFGGTVETDDATGLTNNDTTYKALVTVNPGGLTYPINIKGRDAQTFTDLLRQILYTYHLTVLTLDRTVSGSHFFTVAGDFTNVYPTGAQILYEVADTTLSSNEGVYTVKAPGASFAAGITTIPTVQNFPSALFPDDSIACHASRLFTMSLRSKTGLTTNADIVFESATVGASATISVVDVGPNPLFASLPGFIGFDPAVGGINRHYGDAPVTPGGGAFGHHIVFNVGLVGGELVEIISSARNWD